MSAVVTQFHAGESHLRRAARLAHTHVSRLSGLLIIFEHFPTALPLHYVQGKRGGLRSYVLPGLQATQISSLPNDALDVSPCRIALHSSRSGGDSLSREPEGEVRHVRRADVRIWKGI